MPYLFSSESVSEGHPDKVSDQISDAILDEFLRQDPRSRVACETLVTTKKVIVAGEIRSNATVDVDSIVRRTIKKIGYDRPEYEFDDQSCEIINLLHSQSVDIARGVDQNSGDGEGKTGAGDQGMMFGYAVNETDNKMPLGLYLSHLLLRELAQLRREKDEIPYLRPDAKSQVTIEYCEDTHQALRITNIVLSTQHDDFDEDPSVMSRKISEDIRRILIPRVKARCTPDIQRLFEGEIDYKINPTGNFVIGGPHGDTGLTGRKIIVDTYGGHGAHGGGAFSGKDASKVDRSAAYACRHIARNLVAAGVADRVLVQLAYAIGVPEPVSFYLNTYGTAKVDVKDGELAKMVYSIFDLQPHEIIQTYKLDQPIFEETASFGHVGRTPGIKKVNFGTDAEPDIKEIETFTWEKEDRVDDLRKLFNL